VELKKKKGNTNEIRKYLFKKIILKTTADISDNFYEQTGDLWFSRQWKLRIDVHGYDTLQSGMWVLQRLNEIILY
jgi:hypothetical protein